jgi:hypothetical protein
MNGAAPVVVILVLLGALSIGAAISFMLLALFVRVLRRLFGVLLHLFDTVVRLKVDRHSDATADPDGDSATFAEQQHNVGQSQLFGPVTQASEPPPPPAPGPLSGFIVSSGGLCKVRNKPCETEQHCRGSGCPYS